MPASMKSQKNFAVRRPLRLGIDIGSTTLKLAVLDDHDQIIYSKYARHYANLKDTLISALQELDDYLSNRPFLPAFTGSGSIDLAGYLELPFIQEVTAGYKAIKRFLPEAAVVIEIGGEDSKIIFLENGTDLKMNGICAGGTGAFIDQMALLLNTDAQGLDSLAASQEIIYPIAARCGVFAKTDIQPLLSQGAKKEDIAASVLQAVVNQTISGLAAGRPIRGKTVFLGGPLHFLPELRRRFQITLELNDNEVLVPKQGEIFVAIGAALAAPDLQPNYLLTVRELISRLNNLSACAVQMSASLPVLFKDKAEYTKFRKRHQKKDLKEKPLEQHTGPCFLGLDIGSTTSKAALIDHEGSLLYSFYTHNLGTPLDTAVKILKDLYEKLPAGAYIARAGVTGYGEKLVKAALNCDTGEVETVCHYKAAAGLLPDVDLIIDIGGQDMKCIKVKNGVIEEVVLNEACSSGCGSFIETFACSLGMNMEEFVEKSLFAAAPADLGSRCTVFMNSKVKEAQKKGLGVDNIAAGLCYSVIKNALYKVLKIRSNEDLGEKILVQGGTFLNDAVLRCLELILKKEVIRPDKPHIMGALGAAMLAKESWQPPMSSKLISKAQLAAFSYNTHTTRCGRCPNNCLLTVIEFPNQAIHISGNRCEKGSMSKDKRKNLLPDLYTYKYERLFNYYKPLAENHAPRGSIGIPRVLNMYENYPFWFTFFTKLGFRVVLSPPSSKKIYEKGMDTIASDTACYPAKLVHGHIAALIEKNVDRIFYPCLPTELPEIPGAERSYNCPMITGYPEVIKANMDLLQAKNIKFHNPFLPYNNTARLIKRLYNEFKDLGITMSEIAAAVEQGRMADRAFKNDIRLKGEEIISWLEKTDSRGIILAGRPYHLDPEVNHGIPNIITGLGLAVLTEDSVAHLGKVRRPLRVIDQWMYHSRLYEAADVAAKCSRLELVQLNSFGCGPDSIAAEQAEEILSAAGKHYTVLKIDEGQNLGAIQIRLRSLLAAMQSKKSSSLKQYPVDAAVTKYQPKHIKTIQKEHTIIAPQMAPIHFELIESAVRSEGIRLEVLKKVEQADIELGLKYVNNDSCYPSIIVIGQILRALQSGKYDLNRTSVLLSQTGGPCRASNYTALLKKALQDADLSNIPVISLNLGSLLDHSGFKVTGTLIKKALMAIIYGDLLLKLLLQVRPYEKHVGAADRLFAFWLDRCKLNLQTGRRSIFRKNLNDIVRDFEQLETVSITKPKVGLSGEIMVKYHPAANKNMAEFIEKSGAELVVPGFAEFFLYCAYERIISEKYLDGSKPAKTLAGILIKYIESYRNDMRNALKQSTKFKPPAHIEDLASSVKSMLSLCNSSGEGWLLTAEMIELIEEGAHNLICMQPFACLPNHITGRGMIKLLKTQYPHVNIVTVDYDPGASDAHQINRIKLMLDRALSDKRPVNA